MPERADISSPRGMALVRKATSSAGAPGRESSAASSPAARTFSAVPAQRTYHRKGTPSGDTRHILSAGAHSTRFSGTDMPGGVIIGHNGGSGGQFSRAPAIEHHVSNASPDHNGVEHVTPPRPKAPRIYKMRAHRQIFPSSSFTAPSSSLIFRLHDSSVGHVGQRDAGDPSVGTCRGT